MSTQGNIPPERQRVIQIFGYEAARGLWTNPEYFNREQHGIFGSQTTGRVCNHRNISSLRCSSGLRCVNEKESLEPLRFILF